MQQMTTNLLGLELLLEKVYNHENWAQHDEGSWQQEKIDFEGSIINE